MQPVALDEERSLRPIAAATSTSSTRSCAPTASTSRVDAVAAEPRHESTQTYVRTAQEQVARGDGVQLAITQRVAHRRHGRLPLLSRIHSSTSIGYWVDARAQAAAKMTLAVARLLDHAFDSAAAPRRDPRRRRERPQPRDPRAPRLRPGGRHARRRALRRPLLDLVVYSLLEHEGARGAAAGRLASTVGTTMGRPARAGCTPRATAAPNLVQEETLAYEVDSASSREVGPPPGTARAPCARRARLASRRSCAASPIRATRSAGTRHRDDLLAAERRPDGRSRPPLVSEGRLTATPQPPANARRTAASAGFGRPAKS